MSYDCGLFINTGKEDIEIPGTESNYTFNVYAMLQLVFPGENGIYCMTGEPANYCIITLQQAIMRLEHDPPRYIALNPPNGWGSYEGCLKWLRNILSHCEQHPLATLRIT